MNRVEVANLSKIRVKSGFIKSRVVEVLKIKKIKNKELSVAFISEKKIREFNERYRSLKRSTDVLSFDGKDSLFLGEIIISPETILRRSGEERFAEDLLKVLVHGILHLAGYDHKKTKDREEMRKEEKKILEKI